MRPRAFVKGVTLGLVLASVAAGLAQTGQALLERAEVHEVVHVPVGSFGDRVVYHSAGNERSWCAAGHCGEAATTKTSSWNGEYENQIDGPFRVTDQTGRVRTVVAVATAAVNASGSGDPIRFLDIDRRTLVRFDEGRDSTFVKTPVSLPPSLDRVTCQAGLPNVLFSMQELGGSRQYSADLHLLGPDFDGEARAAPLQPWRMFLFQGLSLRPGADHSHQLGPILSGIPHWNLGHKAWVDAVGVLDGARVAAVRIEEPFRWGGERLDCDGRIIGRTSYHGQSNLTLWFQEDRPYPILIRSDYWKIGSVDGQQTYRFTGSYEERFVERRQGEGPIPWGPDVPWERSPAFPFEISSTAFPGSGAAWIAPYRLEQAIRNMELDLSFVPFQIWRIQNPGYQVVGFKFEADAGEDTWSVAFSAGGTNHFIAQSRWRGGSVVNQVDPAWAEVPREEMAVDLALVPERFVTLSAAAAQWRNTMSPEVVARGANWAVWGFPFYEQTWTPPSESTFAQIKFGRVDAELPPLPRARRDHTDVLWQTVVLDAATGNVSRAFESRFENAVAPSPLVAGPSGGPPAESVSRSDGPSLFPAAVSVGVFSLFMLTYFFPAIRHGFILLFTKITRARVLHHELRRRVHAAIQENPGITPPRLGRLTEAPPSTLNHHLDVLVRSKLVVLHKDGRHRRYFLTGAVDHARIAGVSLLQNAKTREVYDLVCAQPGIDRRMVGSLMGWTPGGALWHLERLRSHGLIRAARTGHVVAYWSSGRPSDDDRALEPQSKPAAAGRRSARVADGIPS